MVYHQHVSVHHPLQERIRKPQQCLFRYLGDEHRHQRVCQAIQQAVAHVCSSGRECRVLFVGLAGAGMLPVVALSAGAKHVTAVEE